MYKIAPVRSWKQAQILIPEFEKIERFVEDLKRLRGETKIAIRPETFGALRKMDDALKELLIRLRTDAADQRDVIE